MTHSIGGGADGLGPGGLAGGGDATHRTGSGPDPVGGAGVTLLGIFLMATGGARDAHYVFDAGVLLAVAGAVTFVVCVALSALRQRRAG